MPRNGDPASRATTADLPKARPWLWWLSLAGCVLASAALIVGPYLLVSDRPAPAAPTAVSTTVTWVVVQPALLVLTALLAMYSFGRARIEGSASRGLHVDVSEFADDRDGAAPSARELTAGFTRKLTESRIYSPAALPGAAGSYDFLQVVENVGDAATASWWKIAARALRLLRPPAAYRVTGTVATADRPKLVVELMRLPKFAAAPLIIEDTTWDRVLERAANSVAAQIFPRSRICKRRPQWASWWGYAFPSELFDAYQRAHQFQAERRFDQALAEFYRALRLDPANVYIRLEIAQLQERMNMHLDALVTYDDVITICSRGNEGLARWWNGADFGEERSRAHRHQGVALLVARFRHALMLGHGDRIADQWWLRENECGHEPHWNARQRQRGYLRDLAQRRLDRYTLRDHIRKDSLPFTDELTRDMVLATDGLSALSRTEREHRAAVLRQYLCTLSQYEFERLITDYPRYSRWIRRFAQRDSSAIVTLRGLQVSLIWAVFRRAMAQAGAGAPIRYQRVWKKAPAPPWLSGLLTEGTWPATEKRLRRSIDALIPRFGRASWHEHYNVACICAVPLLEPAARANDDSRIPFRKLAISHLHRAAAGSHSGYLAQRRSWLLYEDPDLATLRGTPEFRNFEMVTFSPTRPVPLRPLRTHVWELVSYQVGLIAGTARRMAELWANRATAGGGTPADLEAWHALECGAWRQIARLSVSHRDWRTRHDADLFLAEELHGGGVGLPTFSQEGLYTRYANAVGEVALRDLRTAMNDSIAMVDRLAEEYIATCNDRMAVLAAALHQLDRRPKGDATCPNAMGAVWSMPVRRSVLVASFDPTTSSARTIGRLCLERHRLWTALADLFDDDLEGASLDDRQDHFRKALHRPGLLTRIAAVARSAEPGV
ncbi:tetratricopeptide repeat protein [Actinophytocola algeriensis]|uniref:Tetratricopeptide repeat protein n=1 Tax=Actinophytocola algeriensis TaxID=1768010 RepID=A0A7W7Q115_9PSEU|nr:hypothetical protein [Actinophytocola algeriensis]MBB4905019.1 hypothetical protein [Actinophytocola algeriensis]MBE1476121.1 hypothetical protein [Actinophytocola algeriensis]